ncbi:MAG TPA: DEAD/DEAH box helicase [Candidatus Corynebacterium gallistercoris]|uniref:DEAD/DEAH box helicase n=1 Tax=Candidatus Corynebacterium gallistercoris TaxID=2838530 RepID=A0A9D1RVX0_9CORY|nr:DEAD/DEAH box helicase [Candidatus Corynebacterium gallistercoris]
MEYSHQLHAVVPARGGVELWVERVEGHVVVGSAKELEEGDLPAAAFRAVLGRVWRVRGDVQVATPRGKVKSIGIPTLALSPDEAVDRLGKLCEYANGFNGGVPGLSPEVIFLLDLFRCVDEIVRAGRVMVRVEKVEEDWFPRWTISTAGQHHAVLQRFAESVPEVLVRNGGADVVERFADDCAHWLSVRYLRQQLAPQGVLPAKEFGSAFIRSLVMGAEAKRMSVDTVTHLGQWLQSARAAASQTVFVLSAPDDVVLPSGEAADTADLADIRWRLDVATSANDGPLEPVKPAETQTEQKKRIKEALNHARRVWPAMNTAMDAVDMWLSQGIWFPPQEVLTGDTATDRVLSIGLDVGLIGDLLDNGVNRLQAAGFRVMIPRAWARQKAHVTMKAEPVGYGQGDSKMGLDQLMDFSWKVSVGGEEVPEDARNQLLNSAASVVNINGHFVFMDSAALRGARAWFRELTGGDEEDGEAGEVTLRDILEADALSAAESDVHDYDFSLVAEGWASRILGHDSEIDPPPPVTIPATVVTTLRDHQRRGVNWLVWMLEHNLGAVLADDMGLGKTLQILALLAWEKENRPAAGPTLVVAPTSVVQAWKDEAARHVPSLTVLVDHGSSRKKPADFYATIEGKLPVRRGAPAQLVDLVITTYGTLQRNPDRYWAVDWGRVVADEAQAIKNPNSKQSQAVRNIPAAHHVALTGTPVENRLSDLYAIMDFANPGILGSHSVFQARLAVPIERRGDELAKERLRRLVQPFILRRLKTDEAMGLNLPEKETVVEKVPLSAEQAALYQAYVSDLEQRLKRGGEGRRGAILGALVRFKQICNHPAHFAGDGSGLLKEGMHRSAKVERIFDIVAEAVTSGRKVLLFTQFPAFGRILIPELEKHLGTRIPMLHGGLSRAKRTAMVDNFQRDDGPPVMVLSVRAGGTGITLTQASVVVHMDRWWNPAVEDQATDRAYRIGQSQNVTVYKLVTMGTIDERIHDIIMGKRELAGDIVGMGEGWIANLDDDDLAELWHLRQASDDLHKGLQPPDDSAGDDTQQLPRGGED